MSGLIVPHRGFVPKVASSAFIAANATLVGDVEIGANASIWFGVILRGDGPGIRIGENSNLQDGTVVHVAARGLMTVVGRNVTVGHMALLHACEVQDGAFIGMRSMVLDGAVVESEAMVAAGALVAAGQDRAPRRVVGRQPRQEDARPDGGGLRELQAGRGRLCHAVAHLHARRDRSSC